MSLAIINLPHWKMASHCPTSFMLRRFFSVTQVNDCYANGFYCCLLYSAVLQYLHHVGLLVSFLWIVWIVQNGISYDFSSCCCFVIYWSCCLLLPGLSGRLMTSDGNMLSDSDIMCRLAAYSSPDAVNTILPRPSSKQLDVGGIDSQLTNSCQNSNAWYDCFMPFTRFLFN